MADDSIGNILVVEDEDEAIHYLPTSYTHKA
jgi:hypothetical protein